jgi:hypothetical protein
VTTSGDSYQPSLTGPEFAGKRTRRRRGCWAVRLIDLNIFVPDLFVKATKLRSLAGFVNPKISWGSHFDRSAPRRRFS